MGARPRAVVVVAGGAGALHDDTLPDGARPRGGDGVARGVSPAHAVAARQSAAATARRITAAHPRTVVVLISVEDPVDISSSAEGSGAVALVRKEDFKPALLCELWATHGRVQQ